MARWPACLILHKACPSTRKPVFWLRLLPAAHVLSASIPFSDGAKWVGEWEWPAQDALAELAEMGYISGDPLATSRRADKFAYNGAGGRSKKRNGKSNARASR